LNVRLRLGFVAVLALVVLLVGASPSGAVGGGLVISQVYGGGGNAGATLKNDFIELFNPGGSPVDVTGWSVQYGAATGTTWAVTSLSGSVPAGGYYLVKEAVGAGGTVDLPAPDATGTIAMSATAGKVVLSSSATALSGCPSGAPVVDLVGYGSTANCSETAVAPAPSNTTADLRVNGGCVDTDNNGTDFTTAAPNPRNTSSASHDCTSTSPALSVGTAPLSGAPGSDFTISATVTPGTNPDSTGLSVACDLTWAHLGSSAILSDQGGGVFSRVVTVPADATPGTKTGGCTVSDDQSRTGASTYSFDVVPGTTDLAPAVSSHTPADGDTGVALNANIGITFTEPVNVTGSWFAISCGTSGSHTAVATGDGTSFLLNPDADFAFSETCTVTLDGSLISDQDTNDPPDTVEGNPSWSFTTASAPLVVVSEVYGGGGNAGATYKNDFIELYNRGSSDVSLNGWSVQYGSSTGTTWQVTNIGPFTLQPGQHYLVQEAQGAGGTVNLPTPDAIGTIAMAAGSGKVAVVNSTTALSGACPTSASIMDLVGYGTANCSETSPTGILTNTTSATRKGGGATDTNNNLADFDTTLAPTPQNSGTGDAAPTVSTKSPDDGATNIAVDSNLTIGFSEPVDVVSGWYTISCATSGVHTAAVGGGPTTFTLNPDVDFANGELCTATVSADKVSDQDVADPPDHMNADVTWTFTVTSTPPVAIHDIQGAAHISPLNNQTVSGVRGIVTAVSGNGYWMQDPNPDADPATSEGIFVFTSSRPSVGDLVSVSARVQEFRPGGSSTNLSTTELSSATTSVVSTGNPLPDATIVGTGGRIPPNQVIEDDATGNVETSGTFDPGQDGLDFWESLEGMRIELNNAVAVGPTNSFGETQVVGDNGDNASSRTARGGVLLRPDDANPERVVADDSLVHLPALNVGDHYTGPLVGVLDYNFGNYFLEVTTAVDGIHDGVTPETAAPVGADQISIGTFNFENLAPTDPQSKFDRLAALVVQNLRSPDLLSGEEVQDNSGGTDDGTVAANQTLDKLVAAIAAAGGPAYDYREIDPVNDQDGGQPGGNIRQVFLFRTDRGLSFVDRPGGGSTTANSVVGTGAATQLAFSPGRIDPTNSGWNSSRKPLAGEFLFRGTHLFVIANHFNSKLGDQPLEGPFQPPVRSSETQRHAQAQIVHDFVASILGADPNANVVVDGDLNDFEFSDTVHILENGVLTDLMDTLPLNERYSYVFEGNSQTLDHILLSSSLMGRTPLFDPVHVNAEFADQASDHDPSVVRLTLNLPPTVSAGGPYSVDEGSSVQLAATGSDPEGGTLTYAWDLDNNGSYETPGQTVTFSAATLDGPSTKTVGVQVTDDGGATATDTATVNVVNVKPTATFNAPASAFAGFPFGLSLTSPHDPSTADTAAGFTYAFDCGSGYGAFGSASAISCPTSDPGSRSVGGKIRDQNGGESEYRATVAVVVTYESLCRLVRQVVTDPTVAQSMCDKLAAAASAASRGNAAAKANQLQAFRNQVDAQIGKSVSAADASLLKTLSTSL
jgi:predicted extracellular nuclease